ncbi:cellulase family glycosylhydrolase [Aquisphaera insulae]|uniref:cellulase family glycosylhydrolase n=1 Tax=Aquisphaera insulae TaxID=2712864 RepID=UPI0013EA3148|nr:cellulase family glycosylhydrolase [Aquisphaera insulae]
MTGLLPTLAAWACCLACAPPPDSSPREVICENGVLRRADSREEVALFGVNYYPPHWQNYLDLKKLGVDFDATVRDDMTHLKRMGLDLIRIHVFDREISDRQGNLVDNEHLRILDRVIAEARARGVALVLTPIAWWPTPNPGEGFSNDFTMARMTTDPASRPPQRRYLQQFLAHRNRFTGIANGEDANIVALELINEPTYPVGGATDAQVTDYINDLTATIRGTGCKKPLFYNGWQGHLAAVGRSRADGCTFGWYPSGLVAGHSLRRNFLPAVADFPDMRSPDLKGKAIGVYEFDSADVPGGYLYVAMARSFRAGGAQFAAQFQYDPLPLAPFNAGWQTHYLNLVYAPGRALGFMVAAEAFRTLPRRRSWGEYPASNEFGGTTADSPRFRIRYEDDLSEAVSPTIFVHSNDTTTRPPAPERLVRIAGVGRSPIVDYDGTGAYFLDRLAPGQWRLEVYPDAVWVNDPFGPDRLDREVSRVYWRERAMRLDLPDLGRDFAVHSVEGPRSVAVEAGRFRVTPGVYRLTRHGLKEAPVVVDPTFVAPKAKPGRPIAAWHEPAPAWVSGKPLSVGVSVAAEDDPRATLRYRNSTDAWKTVPLAPRKPYRYEGLIPGEDMTPGTLAYVIDVKGGKGARQFPGGTDSYAVAVSDIRGSIRLYGGSEPLRVQGDEQGRATPVTDGGRAAMRIAIPRFGPPPSSISVRIGVNERLEPWRDALAARTSLHLRLRAGEPATRAVELVLIERDGSPWGCSIPLTETWQDVRVTWDQLRHFAHWSGPPNRGQAGDHLRIEELDGLNLCIGAWQAPDRAHEPHAIEIGEIQIQD